MREIMGIAEKNQLLVLEDCAQSHGALIDKKNVAPGGMLLDLASTLEKTWVHLVMPALLRLMTKSYLRR